MASTFAPIRAADFVTRFVKNMPFKTVQTDVLGQALYMFWMSAPWRWTLGAFPNIPLVSNTQDYPVSIPSDFLYLYNPFVISTDGGAAITGSATDQRLKVEPAIATGGLIGTPTRCTVIGPAGSTGTFRLGPKPGSVPSNWQATALYKKTAPVLTNANLFTAGVQVFDDEYFWIYESGCLYLGYLYADDQRAGTVQFDSQGKASFTGQRGVFEANIQWLKEREKMLILEPPRPDADQFK